MSSKASCLRECDLCREVERLPWAEEVLVTKSELEEKKQRTAELETQVRHASRGCSVVRKAAFLASTDCIQCVPAQPHSSADLEMPVVGHASCLGAHILS